MSEDRTQMRSDDAQRARHERQDAIRRRSEEYGARWCAEHAAVVGRAVREWKRGEQLPTASVRVYNRQDNCMREASVQEVFEALRFDAMPYVLQPTPFGQVILSPTMYLSANIYQLICAAWALTP